MSGIVDEHGQPVQSQPPKTAAIDIAALLAKEKPETFTVVFYYETRIGYFGIRALNLMSLLVQLSATLPNCGIGKFQVLNADKTRILADIDYVALMGVLRQGPLASLLAQAEAQAAQAAQLVDKINQSMGKPG